jgi:hypothetical protein
MKIRVALTIALAAAVTLGLGAQGKPDFSGRWTSDPDPAAAPAARGGGRAGAPGGARAGGGGRGAARGDMGSGWGSTITITQNASELTVEYVFFARGDLQPPLKFVYSLTGSETTNTVMMGRGMQEQRSRAAWTGNSLVITTTHTFPDPDTGKPVPTRVRQALTLESPALLVVETTREGVLGGPDTTARTEYRKIESGSRFSVNLAPRPIRNPVKFSQKHEN